MDALNRIEAGRELGAIFWFGDQAPSRVQGVRHVFWHLNRSIEVGGIQKRLVLQALAAILS